MTIKSIIATFKLRQTAYANRRTPYLEREIDRLQAELAEAKRAFSARKDLRRQEQKEQPKKGGRDPSEPTKKEKALAKAQLACQEADKAAEQARNIATLKHSDWQRAEQSGVTSMTYRKKLWDEAQSLSTAADGREQEARNAAEKVRKAEQSIRLAAERAQVRRERGETLIDDVSSRLEPPADDETGEQQLRSVDNGQVKPVRQPAFDDGLYDDLVATLIDAADSAVRQPLVDEGDFKVARADDEDLESELRQPLESTDDDPIPPVVTRKRKAPASEASSIDQSQ